jgi:uncharacterized membrane protein YeaQ/YmgE (transglycosylase-associated protein family)
MIVLVLLGIVFVLMLLVVLSLIHSLFGLILFLVVAALCGAVAEFLLGYRHGVGQSLLVGLIGAAVGVILRYIFHLPPFFSLFGVPVVWAILGSFIVVGLLKLATGRRGSLGRI